MEATFLYKINIKAPLKVSLSKKMEQKQNKYCRKFLLLPSISPTTKSSHVNVKCQKRDDF